MALCMLFSGASTSRAGAVSVISSSSGAARQLDVGKARPSMPVAGLPPVRREKRDVSACSPIVARWLQLKHAEEGVSRGGSFSAREAHRVRCSIPVEKPDPRKRAEEVRDPPTPSHPTISQFHNLALR